MDLEKIIVREMIQHDDSIKAIRMLPISIRRFFVQAYQSYIFNKTLSMAYCNNEDLLLPHENDVCFNKNGLLGKYDNDPEQRLAIPFVGYSYYKKTRFHQQISEILKTEGINVKDFFIKEMQEVSNEGGFRNSIINCKNFSTSDNFVNFTLSRGSYATIALREIMKPTDPILAGF